MTHDELKSFTKAGLNDSKANCVCVTFKKADGQERKMRCTIQRDKIPVEQHPTKNSISSDVETDVQRVYDLDVRGWRSFKWSTLISSTIEYA